LKGDVGNTRLQRCLKLGTDPDSDVTIHKTKLLRSYSDLRCEGEYYPESNVPLAKRTATGAQALFLLTMLSISVEVSETPERLSSGAAETRAPQRARKVNWAFIVADMCETNEVEI
jgi:hypothetical protein